MIPNLGKCFSLDIWDLCAPHNIWLLESHIPGVDNLEADYFSCVSLDLHDYSLNQSVFNNICSQLATTGTRGDLFASCITRKPPTYVSWFLDPYAWRVNACSLQWYKIMYIFLPIYLIARTIQVCSGQCETGHPHHSLLAQTP